MTGFYGRDNCKKYIYLYCAFVMVFKSAIKKVRELKMNIMKSVLIIISSFIFSLCAEVKCMDSKEETDKTLVNNLKCCASYCVKSIADNTHNMVDFAMRPQLLPPLGGSS